MDLELNFSKSPYLGRQIVSGEERKQKKRKEKEGEKLKELKFNL